MTALNPASPGKLDLCVSRVIRAPRERVFDAWINPEMRRSWWYELIPEPDGCQIDARVGGTYCMKQSGCEKQNPDYPDDYVWIMNGKFVEILPPERLVFTWNVNHKEEPVINQLVTVVFEEVADGTKVTLTHEGIESDQMRDGTNEGWTQLLERIASLFEQN